ncbi:MAG: histidinol-phosphate transaminase [Desulfobacterales bacterium]|jgi:histidinol-phosphate aminotransferase|nr:histidinol-phosphate transaminase [Desulfobacteraceae bacterium]MBT4364298.1 histidinol-phosphate transaminase [Desulfobacteraceae bacterium]MBT7086866.1 histidinol-phosphate transaminase [Desulfobacterales bacterium]MBT7697636.1 histidinol-phosphate transaminase [Desulfobacterales bacterium]
MALSFPDYILSISPYSPGKPIEELEREYGIKNSIKLASNENPLGASPMAMDAIKKNLKKINRYPDGSGYYLTEKLSKKLDVSPRNIVLGNGSDDVIGMLTRVLLSSGDDAIMTKPSFLMYEILVKASGSIPVFVPLIDLGIDLDIIKKNITSKTRMIFITNPNNPTGSIITEQEFKKFLESIPPEIVVVVDEAYIEFNKDPNCLNSINYISNSSNVVTLRTFSKAYGLAGLRVGYGVMSEEIAGLLNRVRQPFNVNSLALTAAFSALDDQDFLTKTNNLIQDGLKYLYNALDVLGIKYFPTQANFFLIDLKKDANTIFEKMLQHGVIIRSMASYGYPEYIRINVGLQEENARFIDTLKKVI